MSENKLFLSQETRQGRIINMLIFPAIFLAVSVIMNIAIKGELLTPQNLSIIMVNCVPNVFVAWGVSYIWSTGPDFSSAASMVLAAQVGGILAVNFHLGYLGMFGGSIVTAVVLQLISTFLRLKLNMRPWVIGIAMCLIYESFGIMYATVCAAKGQETVSLPVGMCSGIIKMPQIIILLAVGLIFMYLIHTRTSFGMNYRAISCNEYIAESMGIKRTKTIYIGVGIGAVMLAIAGALTMILSSRITAPSNLGSFATISKGLCAWLLSAGMDKKVNPPVAIFISGLFIAIIFNFFTRLGVPQGTWLDTVLGGFILLFLCLASRASKEDV